MDNMLKISFLFFALGGLLVYGCREPYEPDLSDFDHSILVVEGYLEVGGGTSVIKLSRTHPLYQQTTFSPLINAQVNIMGNTEGVWAMGWHEDGYYYTEANLPENQSYVLGIYLGQGHQYLSQEIVPIETPDFDITYQKRDGNLKIYANTFGNESAPYFRWEYEETWMYRTPFASVSKYEPTTNQVLPRSPDEMAYQCWDGDFSRRIILESSSKYENNQIFQKELIHIDSLSEKPGIRYHVKVKQSAINLEAFTFWESIRRNSDDIGDIFSPMPSGISSNLYNADNPDEPVIGYISAGKSVEKSIYINRGDVNWRTRVEEYRGCEMDTVDREEYIEFFLYGGWEPIIEYCEPSYPCGNYFAAPRRCTDCRLRGGTTDRPEFWEDQ
jgi:hypothetical protein